MSHLIKAGMQLAFLWLFITLYVVCIVPLSIVAALIEGEKK